MGWGKRGEKPEDIDATEAERRARVEAKQRADEARWATQKAAAERKQADPGGMARTFLGGR